jgi:nucleoside-triphosphatase THEP1
MEHNPIFETAVDFINKTSRSVFLTGKAGTGKTTFLKYIRENTKKKTIVVAPTGVAAINAGGVTMHSMFQLPLGPFVPGGNKSADGNATDKYSLFKNLRLSQEKRDIVRDVDLVIIDEVSMVRCDTLDAMDAILRYIRRKPNKVFGGVQMLFIGDLFQLPPVVPNEEWSLLKDFYQSQFFFHSRAIQECNVIYIELKKIYRQSDQRFIDILNRVRHGAPEDNDLSVLNKRLHVKPDPEKYYVTLTSHNYKADRINQEELRKLTGKTFEYKGEVQGDFPDKVLPTDVMLQLKVGAQIMFIRNDNSEDRRYFNGKLATVTRIDNEGVFVNFKDDDRELLLEKDTWENMRYSYNASEAKINEEKIGSFSQYPVRLAWAITIHKSQGLTFDYAIIDAGESFASGQVYVALSRCRSLEGIILTSPLSRKNISTDERVLAFAREEKNFDDVLKVLGEEQELYSNSQLVSVFDVALLMDSVENHGRHVKEKLAGNKIANSFAAALTDQIRFVEKISLKFQLELESLLREKEVKKIEDRTTKAIEYFQKTIASEIIKSIDDHAISLKGMRGASKYLRRIHAVRKDVISFSNQLRSARYGERYFNLENVIIDKAPEVFLRKKRKKGDTVLETLKMIEAGKSVTEICAERGLVRSTIEEHLVRLVIRGKVDIDKVVSADKLGRIQDAIDKLNSNSVSQLKQRLGSDYSFGEIRAVIGYLELASTSKK